MTDALRSERPAAAGDAPDRERDARIEDLLLVGLDHYFAGQYELAINVWTRVLFLDRGHARARAYIERARSAVSERQREGDELLHTGAAALKRGDRAAARELLTSAIERGGSGEEALALLHRLDRIDAAVSAVDAPPSARRPAGAGRVDHQPIPAVRDSRLAWVVAGILAGVLFAAVLVGYLWIVANPLELDGSRTAAPPVVEDPLPVPSGAEMRLIRARALVAKGQLREALAILESGTPDAMHQARIDALRASIQRQLLQTAGSATIER